MSKKEMKSQDMANVELARALASSIDLEGERAFWVEARSQIEDGELSVRGLKATIQLVEQTGQAPTIRSSWSQYFEDAYKVEDLEGGASKSLKEILNVTIQGTRKAGGRGGFAEVLEGVKTFAQLAKKVEAMPKKEKAKAEGENETEALISADSVISFFIGAMADLEDITPRDSKQWEKFLNIVKTMSEATRATHPAVRSKAKVNA